MHTILKLIVIILVFVFFNSCKKTEFTDMPIAALNVINATIDAGNIKLNTNERDSVKINNYKIFSIVPHKNILLYATNNPAVPFYNGNPGTENGGMYSIYIAGQAPDIESIFVKENAIPMYTDSIIGVAIVNLSPNSSLLSVNIASTPTTNLFSNINYKQITDIQTIPLPGTVSTTDVTFEVRDQDGAVLAFYTLPDADNFLSPVFSIPRQRFKNIKLIIKGLVGTTEGPNAFGIFPAPFTY
ncbi:MAG: hypothetical protein J7497_07105 [Chitinophagaceae bacterium]|nr:hypothetical protein [Chitinophagaceae bacterium]